MTITYNICAVSSVTAPVIYDRFCQTHSPLDLSANACAGIVALRSTFQEVKINYAANEPVRFNAVTEDDKSPPTQTDHNIVCSEPSADRAEAQIATEISALPVFLRTLRRRKPKPPSTSCITKQAIRSSRQDQRRAVGTRAQS